MAGSRKGTMRHLAIIALLAAASPVLDNPRVRAYRSVDASLAGVKHGPAVVISLTDADGVKAGTAVWVEDAAVPSSTMPTRAPVVIVQPVRAARATAAAGSKPGDAPFTGMSFQPIFENDRVSVI